MGTLDVMGVTERGDETTLTARVEGTLDRTGLPEPPILEHELTTKDGKIAEIYTGSAS